MPRAPGAPSFRFSRRGRGPPSVPETQAMSHASRSIGIRTLAAGSRSACLPFGRGLRINLNNRGPAHEAAGLNREAAEQVGKPFGCRQEDFMSQRELSRVILVVAAYALSMTHPRNATAASPSSSGVIRIDGRDLPDPLTLN